MRLPLAALLAAAAATSAAAGEMSDTLCPILAGIAAEYAAAVPEAAQAQLVIAVGSAYDFEPDALNAVLERADAATTAACPADRAAVLDATGKDSLTDAMR